MLQFCNEKRKKSVKIQEKNFHENHDFCGFSDFERHFFDKICLNFRFLSSMSARSRRALANLEKRIQKFIDTAFFWPVEVGKILMRLLIVILNKLVRIISRRNRLVSKIALGDHLVGWSSIRGSIFRRIGYVLRGTFVFLTRARARGVRGYFWDSGSFRRRAGCGRRFCDFRKRFIFARIEKVSIPLYAGGRPVLRNICKIAKFVDTAENRSKRVLLRIP